MRLFFCEKRMAMIIITNAHIHTFENDMEYPKGYVCINGSRIHSCGAMKDLVLDTMTKDEYEIIDAEGADVYPGFVDAHTHLGMFGDSLTFEGDDGNEDTDPVFPQLRAIDAIDPQDGYFREALSAGITTVVTGPGSANPVAGQLAAIKTYGRVVDRMIVKAPVGIKFSLGENPKSTYNDKDQTPVTRMATAALIREALAKAKKYYCDKQRYESDKENYDDPEPDSKNEALVPLFAKEIPAHFHVHRSDDIFTAIRIAREFDIDYVLVHATDAYLFCDELKDESFKGILSGPVLTDRSKPELRNHSPKAAGIISNSGMPLAIITDHPETPIQYLTICAAVAVRNGMDHDEALKAITIYPAAICGLDDRIGSIRQGKDADLVLFRGDPLDYMQTPWMVFAGGRLVRND